MRWGEAEDWTFEPGREISVHGFAAEPTEVEIEAGALAVEGCRSILAAGCGC